MIHHSSIGHIREQVVDSCLFPVVMPGPSDLSDTWPAHSAKTGGHSAAPLEALSQRELEVLRYVPSVLSAAEIGAALYVSVNTVKAHLRSIYRKLGVSRRRDAVIEAHRYGLL